MKAYTTRSLHKMRYNDIDGQGAPILFIHGLGCAGSFDYVEVVSNSILSTNRRIVVDLLGAGYSDKPTTFNYSVEAHAQYLNEFIEDLNIDKLHIFGHSLGGAIAIELCRLCESKVLSLTLSESNLDPSSKTATSFELAQLDEDDLERVFKKQVSEYVQIGSAMWAASLSNWLPKAVVDISKSAVVGGGISWRKLLYEFTFPRTFIFGENSLPDKDYDILFQRGINISVVKNAGHSMAWENPSGLALAIKKSICNE